MGASAAGLQEPELPLFLVRPHHVEATNKEKIYEFYSAEKEKEKSLQLCRKERCSGTEAWRNY